MTDLRECPMGQPQQHSPLPWLVRGERADLEIVYLDPLTDREAPLAFMARELRACEANAEFIVRAANAHHDLLAALKLLWLGARECGDWSDDYRARIEAALAKAEPPALAAPEGT